MVSFGKKMKGEPGLVGSLGPDVLRFLVCVYGCVGCLFIEGSCNREMQCQLNQLLKQTK